MHVYIVRCRDGTSYTGKARIPEKGIEEHNSGDAGARYTRSRGPVKPAYAEESLSRSAALKREHERERMTGSANERLIDGQLRRASL